MALRVAIARFQLKTVGAGPSLIRVNNSFRRFKHFDGESPLAKHTKKRNTSTLRVIGNGIAIGVVLGVGYTYFAKSERKLPGVIVNEQIEVPVLEKLPPGLKVTRKVRDHLH